MVLPGLYNDVERLISHAQAMRESERVAYTIICTTPGDMYGLETTSASGPNVFRRLVDSIDRQTGVFIGPDGREYQVKEWDIYPASADREAFRYLRR